MGSLFDGLEETIPLPFWCVGVKNIAQRPTENSPILTGTCGFAAPKKRVFPV